MPPSMSARVSRFNSKLVRLKVATPLLSVVADAPSFNSKLVRLKGRIREDQYRLNKVSIPNWCD